MRRMAPDALHSHCNFYIPVNEITTEEHKRLTYDKYETFDL